MGTKLLPLLPPPEESITNNREVAASSMVRWFSISEQHHRIIPADCSALCDEWLEVDVPRFRRQFLAEAFVFLPRSDLESSLFVDVASGGEIALGPKADFFVTNLPGETNAFVDETFADA